jgi:hypothetical protein
MRSNESQKASQRYVSFFFTFIFKSINVIPDDSCQTSFAVLHNLSCFALSWLLNTLGLLLITCVLCLFLFLIFFNRNVKNTGQSHLLKLTRNTRSMTRTMKKSSPDAHPRVDSSPPQDSTTRSQASAHQIYLRRH